MEEIGNAKSFLHTWLAKKKIIPEYSVRAVGIREKTRFLCELRVEGFSYVGVGNSLGKKDAQTNAARDFVQYLIRNGDLTTGEIPDQQTLSFIPAEPPPTGSQQSFESFPMGGPSRPVFRGGQGPGDLGNAYRRQDGQIPFQLMDAQKVVDAEELDVNASIHGNWTIDNAKGRLHQFMQMNKLFAEYTYSTVGPAHQRSFRADMKFYVPSLGRNINASDTGSTKQTASKSCALSLVRQLFHLGVIEAFSGTLKRTKDADTVKPFETSIDPAVMQNVNSILGELGIMPKSVDENLASATDSEGNSIGISLLPDSFKKDVKYDGSDNSSGRGIVSWSPPLPNWNPWTNCNIDEGHMSTASLEQLSSEFLESFRIQQQTNENVQKMLEVRSKLPVYQKRADIMEAISENQVILIKGETGSGKTTQICQFIMDDYIMSEQGAYCNIVVTQPRRISAISISERIASERGEDLGQSVGYSVRFESCLPRPYASILFCTVGVLLRKLEGGLRGVSHVIVDEIHERDVNSDFILIVLRDMLAIYPDLRVILMSATIDTKLFTDYFNSCPVLEIQGRAFPVETYFLEDVVEALKFRPSPESLRRARRTRLEDGEDNVTSTPSEGNMNILPPGSGYSANTEQAMKLISERDLNYELVVALLTHIRSLSIPGSVLVFLPGWSDIFGVLKYLQDHPVFGSSSSYVLLPLHSQLPREDQHRVFEPVPSHMTKIILATNIAETSITIDDVVFVIDSCKAKMKLFTSHNNMTTFATVWASKSNLMQRKGRAGRVKQGYCYHLCSRARYQSLDANMVPEMLRTPLHEIALSIKLLRLGGIGHFLSKAADPPTIDTVIEAQVLLTELNCLDETSELTPLGKILAKLPLDPRLGKMLVLGTVFGCADPLAIISAQSSNLSEVFILENRSLAPQQRWFAARRHSDHFAYLNAFQQWNYHKERGERAEMDFCNQRLLSFPSLRSTSDAKNQLLQVLQQCGFPEEQLLPCRISFRQGEESSPVLNIIAALLCSGLYPNVCYHTEKRKVLTTESKSALIHKASVNCSRMEIVFPYPYFIFGEKIRTRAIACKQTTMINPVDLLLFGARKVEFVQGMVRLDNWINLQMSPRDAAAIVALRPAIENLITRVVESPETFFPLHDLDQRLTDLVTELSKMIYEVPQQDDADEDQGSQRPASGWGMNRGRGFGSGGYRGFTPQTSFTPPMKKDPYSLDPEYFDEQQIIPGSDDANGNNSSPHGIKRNIIDEEGDAGSHFIPPKMPNYVNPGNSGSADHPPPSPRGFGMNRGSFRGQGFGGQGQYRPPRFSGGGSQFGGNSYYSGGGGGRGGGGFPSRPFGSRNASPHRGWSARGSSYGGGGRRPGGPGRFNRGGFQQRGNYY